MSEKDFKNLILITGDEDYLIEQKKNELLKALDAEGSINYNAFSGENLDLDEIKRLIDTVPLMEEYRKILISDSGLMSGGREEDTKTDTGDTEADENGERIQNAAGDKGKGPHAGEDVLSVFSDMPGSTVVIFAEKKASASSPLYKLIKKNGTVYTFKSDAKLKGTEKRENETAIRRWASDKLKKEKRNIDGGTLNRLLQTAGYDMMNLDTELEKLICYKLNEPEGYRFTEADIDAVSSKTLQDRVFDMIDYKLKGNTVMAVRLLEELFALKTAPMKIIYLLARQYNQALGVRECLDKRYTDAETSAHTELKDWQIRKIKGSVSGVSAAWLTERLENLCELEFKIKQGDLSDRIAAELAVMM